MLWIRVSAEWLQGKPCEWCDHLRPCSYSGCTTDFHMCACFLFWTSHRDSLRNTVQWAELSCTPHWALFDVNCHGSRLAVWHSSKLQRNAMNREQQDIKSEAAVWLHSWSGEMSVSQSPPLPQASDWIWKTTQRREKRRGVEGRRQEERRKEEEERREGRREWRRGKRRRGVRGRMGS